MVRAFGLLTCLLTLALAGCSGSGGAGCDAQFRYFPRASYAGSYAATFTATFTPTGGAAESFALSVSTQGVVTGTTTRSGSTVDVAGVAGDTRTACVLSNTGFALQIAPQTDATETLTVAKSLDQRLVGAYSGTLTRSGGAIVTGSFTVSRSGAL